MMLPQNVKEMTAFTADDIFKDDSLSCFSVICHDTRRFLPNTAGVMVYYTLFFLRKVREKIIINHNWKADTHGNKILPSDGPAQLVVDRYIRIGGGEFIPHLF